MKDIKTALKEYSKLESEYTYALEEGGDTDITRGQINSAWAEIEQAAERIERDALTLALRLIGEDRDTFAPETTEVMDRMRPTIKEKYGFDG